MSSALSLPLRSAALATAQRRTMQNSVQLPQAELRSDEGRWQPHSTVTLCSLSIFPVKNPNTNNQCLRRAGQSRQAPLLPHLV
eukprot:SM000041S15461  [mRNA]  locus=s41:252515:252862:+ [translate_table: standard]